MNLLGSQALKKKKKKKNYTRPALAYPGNPQYPRPFSEIIDWHRGPQGCLALTPHREACYGARTLDGNPTVGESR